MKKKKILVLTDYSNAYRQDMSRSQGIDLQTLVSGLSRRNDVAVEVKRYNDILNHTARRRYTGYYILYTSSENLEYKEYIKDIVYDLGKENILVPGFDFLMCHEDKLYQEIFKKRLGIQSLDYRIYAAWKDLKEDLNQIAVPVVVKKCAGAGSVTVRKADTKKQLLRQAKRMMLPVNWLEYYVKAFYKKMKGSLSPYYFEDEKHFGRIVLQQYVPGLQCDWKVLVFGRKYYALRRSVRKRDFRASGSGIFSFAVPEDEILDYARDIFERLQVPFLSLDLCIDKKKRVYLIEFQGIHFGPYALVKSPHYFIHQDGWKQIKAKSNLAEEYADSVLQYIDGQFSSAGQRETENAFRQ